MKKEFAIKNNHQHFQLEPADVSAKKIREIGRYATPKFSIIFRELILVLYYVSSAQNC